MVTTPFALQGGVVSSSNNLGTNEADSKQMEANDASVKEMEAAGIAWSAHMFGTPFFALKSITDIVDGDRPPQEEFLENLQKAAIALKVSFFCVEIGELVFPRFLQTFICCWFGTFSCVASSTILVLISSLRSKNTNQLVSESCCAFHFWMPFTSGVCISKLDAKLIQSLVDSFEC